MSISQVIAILWARKPIILVAFIASVVISVVVVQTLPKRYVATSSVIMDLTEPEVVTGQMMPMSLVRAHIRTQIRLITSDKVAMKVVDRLNLAQSPSFVGQFLAEMDGQGDIRHWIGRQLREGLKVQNVNASKILAISYESSSPQLAASVANAFADAYIETDLELRVDPSRRNAQWFSGQINNLRQALADAQSRFTEYQQRTGIISVNQELDAENAKLADLTRRLTAAGADASEARSLVEQLEAFDRLRGSGGNIPEFMSSPEIEQRRGELTRIDAQMAAISGSVGVNHPEHKALLASRNVVEDQLEREIKILRQTIYARETIAEAKVNSLQTEMNTQKEKLLKVRQDRNQLETLLSEVEIRKAEYDNALRRASTLRLEGEVSQTAIAVMEEAVPPESHDYPKKQLTVSLAAGFGFMLGVVLAFLFE